MTHLETTEPGTVDAPVPIRSLPFAQTIDVSERTSRRDEPSPCVPTAACVWYAVSPAVTGRLVLDLGGSTPLDPVVRAYRRPVGRSAPLLFLGCASPVWNAQLSLEVPVDEGERVLVQVGTSESEEGRLVLRVEFRAEADRRQRLAVD